MDPRDGAVVQSDREPTMLEVPHFFSKNYHLYKRFIMRLCFLCQHGRTLEPPFTELNMFTGELCRLLGQSEAEAEVWFATWVDTPLANQLGALLSL